MLHLGLFGRQQTHRREKPGSRGTGLCLALITGMSVVFICAGCRDGDRAPAGLLVDGDDFHDFGDRRQEETLNHTFSLVNTADVPVKIVGLETSCHCIVAASNKDLGSTTIAPGQNFDLPVRLETGAIQGQTSGTIRVVYRKLDDPVEPDRRHQLVLRVRAGIIPEYRISPREIEFGTVDGLVVKKVSRTFKVVPEAAVDVKIGSMTCSKFLTAQLLPKQPGDATEQIQVTLDLSGFSQDTDFRGHVTLSTDSERLPKAVVWIRATYDAPAEAEPSILVIGSDKHGEVKREIRVRTSRPARLRLVGSFIDERIRVEFNGQAVAREHILHVYVAPCGNTDLNSELPLELEFSPGPGNTVLCPLRIPIHRLLEKGAENA